MSSILAIAIALSALIAVYLLTQARQDKPAHAWLGTAFGLISLQQALTLISLSEGFDAVNWGRPIIAPLLPVVLWLQVQANARTNWHFHPRHLALVLPACGIVILRLTPALSGFLDGAMVLIYLGFAVAIGLPAWRGAEPAPGQTTGWGELVSVWLVAIALSDLAITLELAGGTDLTRSHLLATTLASLVAFLAYALLSGLQGSGPLFWLTRRRRSDSERRQKLETHMDVARPWLDPELTTARLGRQLGLPQRAVSETVNDSLGMSVSRWINTYRIAEAQRLMQSNPDRPLVDLMLECGFQTRSNFNKAFKDVTGETPSAWRRGQVPVKA